MLLLPLPFSLSRLITLMNTTTTRRIRVVYSRYSRIKDTGGRKRELTRTFPTKPSCIPRVGNILRPVRDLISRANQYRRSRPSCAHVTREIRTELRETMVVPSCISNWRYTPRRCLFPQDPRVTRRTFTTTTISARRRWHRTRRAHAGLVVGERQRW